MARCVSPISRKTADGVVVVPCGKCNYCLQSRREDWSFRLRQELKHSLSGYFITLTYDDGHLPTCDQVSGEYFPNGTLVKSHAIGFVKRLRAHCSAERLRFYLCGEYGTRTGRAHYHVLLFNLSSGSLAAIQQAWSKFDFRRETYDRIGHVSVFPMNDATIHYTTKYVINRVGDYGGREPPFCLMSRQPGIGAQYLATHTKWHRDDMRPYTRVNGIYARLPRYYKEKMFDCYERMDMAELQAIEHQKREREEYEDRLERGEDIRYEGVQRIVNHELVFKRLNEKNKL